MTINESIGTNPSLALNPTNWNQSKSEQYISSSVTPVACHIPTSYLLPTFGKLTKTDEIDFYDPFFIIFANRIPVSITFFHLPATLLSFADYVLPHLSPVQSHEPKSFNH